MVFFYNLIYIFILLSTRHFSIVLYLFLFFNLHIIYFICKIYIIKQFWCGGIWEHHEMKAAFVELLHFHGVYWLISGCVAVKAGTRILSMWCATPAEHRALTILLPSFLFASQLLLQEMCCWFNDVVVFLGLLFRRNCWNSQGYKWMCVLNSDTTCFILANNFIIVL